MTTAVMPEIAAVMEPIGRAAVESARVLAQASTDAKNRALLSAARALRSRSDEILAANAADLREARAAGAT
ncbi:MAG: hypothetical protein WBO04_00810, partial [Steroidobacteraceae bacterium]